MGRLFGTDGVRGVANQDLTCELAMTIGRAAACALSSNRRRRPVVLVGMDPRISSDMLASAVTAGLCSVGADVLHLGVIPTPAVAYLVGKYKADAGVMITASHNPAEYNGIKIFGGDGFKLPDALEEEIETLTLDPHRARLEAEPLDLGKLTWKNTVVKDYVAHLKSTVAFSLEGLKVAVDCANGAASVTAHKLFDELGAQATFLADEPDGLNINENCGSTHMERLIDTVKSGGFDAGIAFDGDADRCLAVDERGLPIDGDQIMAVCAKDMKARGKLPHDTVIGTILTNLGFVRFCKENGLNFIATKVGDRFVLEEMLLGEFGFGGEQSGHVIFRDFATTGDGQLTAIQLLSLVRREGKKLSELADVMNRYPQVSRNVRVSPDGKLAFYTDQTVKTAIEEAKTRLGEDGRLVVRVSGTEPLVRVMVEGRDLPTIESIADDMAGLIKERLAAG
ncbi:MAG: phosphoglucosamine mutase [Oscillospiraceae bacterium]|jgi:phosphoglucosamine mutase|nr:phosphoglucosamine mutase [Oscillospiraceae bacterium]